MVKTTSSVSVSGSDTRRCIYGTRADESSRSGLPLRTTSVCGVISIAGAVIVVGALVVGSMGLLMAVRIEVGLGVLAVRLVPTVLRSIRVSIGHEERLNG